MGLGGLLQLRTEAQLRVGARRALLHHRVGVLLLAPDFLLLLRVPRVNAHVGQLLGQLVLVVHGDHVRVLLLRREDRHAIDGVQLALGLAAAAALDRILLGRVDLLLRRDPAAPLAVAAVHDLDTQRDTVFLLRGRDGLVHGVGVAHDDRLAREEHIVGLRRRRGAG